VALITGATGQVGLELQATQPNGWTLVACGSKELDVTQADRVRAVLRNERPDVVIHTAGFTEVDRAETEAELAEAVNARGTEHLAEAARAVGARLLYVSSDFVFDGASGRPYTPEDLPRPLGVYGRTKLAGERAAQRILGDRSLVVRTAWVYSRHRRNFVQTMLGLMRVRPEIRVVSDQVGTPTWARPLAEALWSAAVRPELHGILHWTDAGVASWYDFAVAIQEEALAVGLLERAVPVLPIRTDEYPTPAGRPSYAVLDKSVSWSLFERRPRHWRQCLRLMLREAAKS
jgi:dTDP-4-dehydrorhamnose reductase